MLETITEIPNLAAVKFEKIRDIAEKREIQKIPLPKCPSLEFNDEEGLMLSTKEGNIPLTDEGLVSFLSLVHFNISTDSINRSREISAMNLKRINRIIKSYWNARMNRPRVRPMVASSVNDHFSKGRFEIRNVHTDVYRPLRDIDLINFVSESLGDIKYFSGYVTKMMTKIRYIARSIKVGDRKFKLGVQIANSEFGTRSIEIALYEVDLLCTNQFVPSHQAYHHSIPHKGATTPSFLEKVRTAKILIEQKYDNYETLLQRADERKLPYASDFHIKEEESGIFLEKVRDFPITASYARIPDQHREGIAENFEVEGRASYLGLRSAITSYLKQNPHLEEQRQITRGVESLI